jgi:hypothetical protein
MKKVRKEEVKVVKKKRGIKYHDRTKVITSIIT